MEKEIEVKFKIGKGLNIESKLLKVGAVANNNPYEQTTIGFFSEDSIEKGVFPRIRNEETNIILTIKVRKEQQIGFKEREEYSMPLKKISDGEDILLALGYTNKRSFMKVRQDWSLLATKIAVDRLYFGDFLEIEGEKGNIEKVVDILGFKNAERITKSYLGLEDDYINNTKERSEKSQQEVELIKTRVTKIKTIREHTQTEQEIKLFTSNISIILEKIRRMGKYVRTEYIKDIIYGEKDKDKKIRLRIEDNFEFASINAIYKYKMSVQDGIKKEIEETIYKGISIEEAVSMIKMRGDFKEENSYEKIRIIFMADTAEITIDIYPFGSWIEIEDEPEKIHCLAQALGFSKKDYITTGADDLYLEWIKTHNLPEQWDVRFGLGSEK